MTWIDPLRHGIVDRNAFYELTTQSYAVFASFLAFAFQRPSTFLVESRIP